MSILLKMMDAIIRRRIISLRKQEEKYLNYIEIQTQKHMSLKEERKKLESILVKEGNEKHI